MFLLFRNLTITRKNKLVSVYKSSKVSNHSLLALPMTHNQETVTQKTLLTKIKSAFQILIKMEIKEMNRKKDQSKLESDTN